MSVDVTAEYMQLVSVNSDKLKTMSSTALRLVRARMLWPKCQTRDKLLKDVLLL